MFVLLLDVVCDSLKGFSFRELPQGSAPWFMGCSRAQNWGCARSPLRVQFCGCCSFPHFSFTSDPRVFAPAPASPQCWVTGTEWLRELLEYPCGVSLVPVHLRREAICVFTLGLVIAL